MGTLWQNPIGKHNVLWIVWIRQSLNYLHVQVLRVHPLHDQAKMIVYIYQSIQTLHFYVNFEDFSCRPAAGRVTGILRGFTSKVTKMRCINNGRFGVARHEIYQFFDLKT